MDGDRQKVLFQISEKRIALRSEISKAIKEVYGWEVGQEISPIDIDDILGDALQRVIDNVENVPDKYWEVD